MAETPRKIHYPLGDDPLAPHTDMRRLAESASVIVPVANRAEADAILSALQSQGVDLSERPLYVDRRDTGTLERNNGNGWVGAIEDPASAGITFETGWSGNQSNGRLEYGHLSVINIILTYSGPTISVGASGDCSNTTVARLPASFRPIVDTPLGSGLTGRVGAFTARPSGEIILAAVGGTADITSGSVFSFGGVLITR